MSQQARYIAGQLVLGRTSPLWQLVRRISGRKRRVGRLVAALKDEDGRVISTPEAAAAMWERKFLEAFSGMGELRDVTERGDEGRCREGDRRACRFRCRNSSLRGGVAPAHFGCPCDCQAWEGAGPDALPAELLKAGRFLAAPAFGSLGRSVYDGRRPGGVAGRPNGPGPQESDAPFHLAE